MKHVILLTTLFAVSVAIAAQPASKPYADIDKRALQLPDSLSKTTATIASYIDGNFSNTNDKVRAIYTWLASNIGYDIENMFAINFYAPKEEKITKPLATRKGICENYAALFTDICTKLSIPVYTIEGYTKQNGFTDYIPHAWNAAYLDSNWYLFDATWGSGYISAGKFYQKLNNNYFKVSPSTLIKSHMPFDYLWQFLHYPITSQEFVEGKTSINNSKPFFNYIDSIKAYEKQPRLEQLASAAQRIEKNGIRHSLVYDRLRHIKEEIEYSKQGAVISKQINAVNLYNSAVADYNDGLLKLNDYINYYNKQFTPVKPDAEIQGMIDSSSSKIHDARKKLGDIKEPDSNVIAMSAQLNKAIDDISKNISEQQEWLKTYFSKNKSQRRSMFYKRRITVFGIPVK